MSPNTGYSAVPADGGDDDAEHYPDGDGDHGAEATQSLELESQQDRHETQRKARGLRCTLLATACLLALVAAGGREYYVRHDGGSADDGPLTGVVDAKKLRARGTRVSDDGGSGNPFSLPSAASSDGDATEDESAGGDPLPDEEMPGEDALELEEEEGEGGETEEDDEEEQGGESAAETEGDVELETFETEIAAAEEEAAEEKGGEGGEIKDEAGGELQKEEEEGGELEEGEEEEDALSPGGDVPDYFTPLTSAEREELRERLRATMRKTRDALHPSATAGDMTDDAPQRSLVLDPAMPKSFMHMHHMKTGGTSFDGLISCALGRQTAINEGTRIKYGRMSECGSGVKRCMDQLAEKLDATVTENVFYHNGEKGWPQTHATASFDPGDAALPADAGDVCGTADSGVMSYCASLHTVRTFGWHDVDKVTVIRHPVDRAWSMYRFRLQGCYKCEELKDVLQQVASGTFGRKGAAPDFVYGPNDSCASQMIGHQATNLLTSVELYQAAGDVRFPREQEIAAEAVRNLRETFTWIGITDRLEESVEGIRTVFPFLAENLSDTARALEDGARRLGEPIGGLLPEGYEDTKGCVFGHRNGGREPTCGTKTLDDDTIHLINTLTARDMAVYRAAVERFELQNEVLEEYRNGLLE